MHGGTACHAYSRIYIGPADVVYIAALHAMHMQNGRTGLYKSVHSCTVLVV